MGSSINIIPDENRLAENYVFRTFPLVPLWKADLISHIVMASNTAPSPSFSGIDFNPGFFSTSTSLTLEEADLLYLNKSTPDTANVLETFTVGISANALIASTATITSLTADASILNGVVNSNVGVLSGNTAFNIVSASFTIPSSINRDYYIFCNANASTYTITLPARLTNQVIHFRNFSGRTLTITAPTTSPTTALYPAGFTSPFVTSWTGFLNNTVQTFMCDGTNWLGF